MLGNNSSWAVVQYTHSNLTDNPTYGKIINELTFSFSLKAPYICCFFKTLLSFLICIALRSSIDSVYLSGNIRFNNFEIAASVCECVCKIESFQKREWEKITYLLVSFWSFCFNLLICALNCSGVQPSQPPNSFTSDSEQMIEAFL